MPNTGLPNRVSPISVPHAGMPQMKDLVPSIGSSTQTYSASGCSLPYSSPMMPCAGGAPPRGLGGRVRRRDRVEAADRALVVDAQRSAEERQDHFTGFRRQLLDEASEIDRRHGTCSCAASPTIEAGTGRQPGSARSPDAQIARRASLAMAGPGSASRKLWPFCIAGAPTHGAAGIGSCLLCGAMAYCCSAATRSFRVPAALLGRFLPRLGALAPASGPFFTRVFRRRPIRGLLAG